MRKRVGALVGLVVVLWLLVPGGAQAKSFRIAAVEIEAVLNPDASMRVVEHLTYDFQGEFHNGTRPIPPGDYQIVDVTVSENGIPLPSDGGPYNLAWHYDAFNERRTFDISYTVIGAAKVGSDVSELYWKWVGADHPGVGAVRVGLSVPGNGADVRAWGHGPLDGGVAIEGNTVRWSVDGLPAGRFVEGRVTVPTGSFVVPPTSGDRLPSVLAEEQEWADDANAARARSERMERLRDSFVRAFPIIPLLGWVGFMYAFFRWGKEHPPARDVGQYLRELPDDPPAFVPMLDAFGTPDPTTLSATIIDLAQRGFLSIEEERRDRMILSDKVDWIMRWQQPPDEVRAWERHVLSNLFASGAEVRHSDWIAGMKRNQTEASRWWERYKELVRKDFKSRQYVEGGRGPAYAMNGLIGAAVVGSGILALTAGGPIGLVGLASGGIQLAVMPVLRRRSPAGAQRQAEWEAVERFLRDFSQLEDAPVGHLILWERYLVYAVALGVSAEVAKAMAMRVPVAADGTSPGFAPWYIGSAFGRGDGFDSFSDFSEAFGPAVVAAAVPSSSSSGSGGGGGFSGGGGGGGGGGGMGAS
ncbi:MAG: DUF2207 family protein [Acidimicrobiales bacterium]